MSYKFTEARQPDFLRACAVEDQEDAHFYATSARLWYNAGDLDRASRFQARAALAAESALWSLLRLVNGR